MALDAWLPKGHKLADGATASGVLFSSPTWQIIRLGGEGRALLATSELHAKWLQTRLIEQGTFFPLQFGGLDLFCFSCPVGQLLCPVGGGRSPDNKSEALSFAVALRATRAIEPNAPLQDAIYVEKISRLLPTY